MDTITTVPKKPVYLEIPFTGDVTFKMVKNTINAAIRRTYNAAQVVMRAITRSLPLPPIKTPKSLLSTSHCIYQFTCSCSDTYIGRTDRRLLTRAREHVPNRLQLLLSDPNSDFNQYKVNSSITRHLIDTRHTVDLESAFRVIMTNVRSKRLKFLEALLIIILKLVLCAQKNLSVTLNLPWFH